MYINATACWNMNLQRATGYYFSCKSVKSIKQTYLKPEGRQSIVCVWMLKIFYICTFLSNIDKIKNTGYYFLIFYYIDNFFVFFVLYKLKLSKIWQLSFSFIISQNDIISISSILKIINDSSPLI